MRAALAVWAGALLLLVSAAQAAPSDAAGREARRHFQAAEARFKAGAFSEALAEYQAGYEAKPLPGFLINIAQCQRRMGDLKAARASYQKFVMVAPDSPLVPQAKTMVEELDKLLADLAGADARKDEPRPDEPASRGADDAGATSDTGSPVVVEAPAAPRSVPPAPGAPAAGNPESLLVASPPPAAAEPAPARTRWWLWGALGAMVAGGVVTAVVLSTGGTTTTVHDGSLGTLRR